MEGGQRKSSREGGNSQVSSEERLCDVVSINTDCVEWHRVEERSWPVRPLINKIESK